ncbi:hypothetical protein DFH27DRAFT_527143 [Peziza echinospora]|nr:hypothetical protein DFH27DRAFT_527143 [Peziza echinospora]
MPLNGESEECWWRKNEVQVKFGVWAWWGRLQFCWSIIGIDTPPPFGSRGCYFKATDDPRISTTSIQKLWYIGQKMFTQERYGILGAMGLVFSVFDKEKHVIGLPVGQGSEPAGPCIPQCTQKQQQRAPPPHSGSRSANQAQHPAAIKVSPYLPQLARNSESAYPSETGSSDCGS